MQTNKQIYIYTYIYIYIYIYIYKDWVWIFKCKRLSFLCRIMDIKIVSINACQSIYQDLLGILPFNRKSKRKECNIFNVQNVFLAKYSFSNIDDVRMQEQKGESLWKMPWKKCNHFQRGIKPWIITSNASKNVGWRL